jgi:hypothetical protein
MKSSFLIVVGVLFNLLVQAQGPAGKWRFVSYTLETRDGKKTDLLKDFLKDYPCTKSTLIHFDAAGNINARADKCPADMRHAGLGTKWKMTSKNKIIVSTDDSDIDPVTYNFELIGNKMRWTINYEKDDSDEVKQLVAEFVKA